MYYTVTNGNDLPGGLVGGKPVQKMDKGFFVIGFGAVGQQLVGNAFPSAIFGNQLGQVSADAVDLA